jgi:polyhydroxyalkanoate synthesis repressor PhaR
MVEIRKYGNRRLYDTRASRYVNLGEIADMVREGEELRVTDVATGQDLTREVLLQVILEVQGGLDFLPVGLLRRIIRATGTAPGDALVRDQLATALRLLHDQLDRVESQFGRLFGGGRAPASGRSAPPPSAPPPPDAAPQHGPSPRASRSRRATPKPPDPPANAPSPAPEGAAPADPELEDLRARLASLEARLKRT